MKNDIEYDKDKFDVDEYGNLYLKEELSNAIEDSSEMSKTLSADETYGHEAEQKD